MADEPVPFETEPEPEGGPLERARAFLDERLTPLVPKVEGEHPRLAPAAPGSGSARLASPADDPVLPAADPGPAGRAAPRDAAPPLPASPPRSDLIRDYRERQKHSPAARPAPREPGVPPAAPLAPPANNWIPIGPSVVRRGQGGVQPATSGRTPAIAVAPGGTRAYVGAANGGVWYTEDGGANWTSRMDAFDLNPTQTGADSLACGAIALVPGAAAAQDRIYVGSGEGPGGAYFGVGALISTDGGANWATEPVSPGSASLEGCAFYAMAVDPADPDRVVAVARDRVGNPPSLQQARIYRREPDGSGGFHWDQKVLPGHSHHWSTSVVFARQGGATTFYAAPWFGPVYSSADGATWTVAGTGFPAPANAGRIALAVQADDPSIVYAFISTGSVFRLDTGDGVWRQVSGLPAPANLVGNQGTYDLAIAVAPDNANRIYLGGSLVFSGGDWSGAVYRSEITVAGASVTAANTYIGNSVHADIHSLVFTPGNAGQLWLGCDGGVYRSDSPTGSGNIFVSCNKGLQTMTQNYLGHHPIEDAVVFSGTQDNGGQRFTGEECWLYSSGGDSGYFVVNWANPYRILDTYVRGGVRRSADGGARYSQADVNVPLVANEPVLFYAPIAGTPVNAMAPAEADLVAFGSNRPWISATFGGTPVGSVGDWQSIPNGSPADQLDERIKCLTFATGTRLYAGTIAGGVYRFDEAGGAWTRTRLDTMGGANALPLAGVVTAVAVDPADATGDSIYITFGGGGDFRHVWHFDGTQWQARSGPHAASLDALLDVQHNAIVADPANPNHLYAGADIGVWFSPDGGQTWSVFSDGLPDAAVLDLKLHGPRRLLRASTHGRGAFERTLDSLPKAGIELYVRDTQLDQGRFPTVNFLPDPTAPGDTVRHWRGPDIKLDTPDVTGTYQFPPTGTIQFLEFVDRLNDDSLTIATHATATITTRVYVQVHNRGVVPADNVQVMCLLANASAGLPPLPPGYESSVQSGTPISTAHWETIGITTVDDVRVGFPRVAAFDLTSDMLPPPANLAGNDHHCVLALLHHPDDPYTANETNTDQNSKDERKAAHKNLKVVQFTGILPAPPPVVIPFALHSPLQRDKFLADLRIELRGYQGQARLFLSRIEADGDLGELATGLKRDDDFGQFKEWAEGQRELIRTSQRSCHPYHKGWSHRRLEDIEMALNHGVMFVAHERDEVGLKRLVLEPEASHTFFLMLDRPQDAVIGEAFNLRIMQLESRERSVTGGLDLRIELQPEPKQREAEIATA